MHRDTEKETGMFATLRIQLPSEHKGGTLTVHHRGEEKCLDSIMDSGDGYYYSACFRDCEHELSPVLEGKRLCLVYNLLRSDYGPLPKAPADHSAEIAAVEQAVETWRSASSQQGCWRFL